MSVSTSTLSSFASRTGTPSHVFFFSVVAHAATMSAAGFASALASALDAAAQTRPSLHGYICELCFDSPATEIIAGDRGACMVCAELDKRGLHAQRFLRESGTDGFDS